MMPKPKTCWMLVDLQFMIHELSKKKQVEQNLCISNFWPVFFGWKVGLNTSLKKGSPKQKIRRLGMKMNHPNVWIIFCYPSNSQPLFVLRSEIWLASFFLLGLGFLGLHELPINQTVKKRWDSTTNLENLPVFPAELKKPGGWYISDWIHGTGIFTY